MSCGNATCASINSAKARAASVPRVRCPWQKWTWQKWSWPLALERLSQIARRCQPGCQYRELLNLNDHLLADIGLSRDQLVDDDLRVTRANLIMWHVDR
jgi:uncharacterized protein YjiS (DUF1127 family)